MAKLKCENCNKKFSILHHSKTWYVDWVCEGCLVWEERYIREEKELWEEKK